MSRLVQNNSSIAFELFVGRSFQANVHAKMQQIDQHDLSQMSHSSRNFKNAFATTTPS
jgi:hypothetical protein